MSTVGFEKPKVTKADNASSLIVLFDCKNFSLKMPSNPILSFKSIMIRWAVLSPMPLTPCKRDTFPSAMAFCNSTGLSEESIRQNWNEKAKSGKKSPSPGFNPNLNIGLEAFDKIFGTNTINIVPQGSAELIFGVNTSKINNPNISERLRKTTTFDFQEKIQMNVTGTIGDKMKVEVNYNTEATFDYENKTKLEYTGKEDEIIKKVEAGNVNLPLTGSLITGSQSLFGIKTELQFGKLWVTAVVSQQKGESSVVEVKGGAQETEYEVTIDNYDSDKHFFLSQFFRDNYEAALKTLPTINSPITITKIEVWLTNKSNNFTDSRNVVAFLDLGEAKDSIRYPIFQLNCNLH